MEELDGIQRTEVPIRPSRLRQGSRDRDILTAEQVAELLQVSTKTVYRLAGRGELRGKKVGRAWRFLRSDIRRYLEGGSGR
jgi:excisionase family DNA binding protein